MWVVLKARAWPSEGKGESASPLEGVIEDFSLGRGTSSFLAPVTYSSAEGCLRDHAWFDANRLIIRWRSQSLSRFSLSLSLYLCITQSCAALTTHTPQIFGVEICAVNFVNWTLKKHSFYSTLKTPSPLWIGRVRSSPLEFGVYGLSGRAGNSKRVAGSCLLNP